MTVIKKTSTNYANKQALADECPEVYAAHILGGQWALVICSWLANGKLRFGELKKRIPNGTNADLAITKIRGKQNFNTDRFCGSAPKGRVRTDAYRLRVDAHSSAT